MALYHVNVRADWTSEERAQMRGLKSAAESKQPGETRSSLEIMKAAYPKKSDIRLGAKGPAGVASAKAESISAKQRRQLREVDGAEMSVGEVGWATEDDCAACKSFPHFADYNIGNLPCKFDWRELGAVGPVLNQKYCGSCWTFSTAQDISGVHFLATGEQLDLSEQQLVACDVGNDGCDGG
jgi:C1A family cysteine protease